MLYQKYDCTVFRSWKDRDLAVVVQKRVNHECRRNVTLILPILPKLPLLAQIPAAANQVVPFYS